MLKYVLSGVLSMVLFAFAGDDLKVGDPAPDFKLYDYQGKVHSLSEYKGQKVALYFYPKNDTPGCTAEACNLRDNYSALQEAGIAILGVSYDDTTSHREFAEKYDLPFPLLADTEKEVAEKYGAKGTITGIMFPKRITFLIDENGKIMHIFDKVDTSNHASQIMAVLEKQ